MPFSLCYLGLIMRQVSRRALFILRAARDTCHLNALLISDLRHTDLPEKQIRALAMIIDFNKWWWRPLNAEVRESRHDETNANEVVVKSHR